mgnify:CR=1 FL=1
MAAHKSHPNPRRHVPDHPPNKPADKITAAKTQCPPSSAITLTIATIAAANKGLRPMRSSSHARMPDKIMRMTGKLAEVHAAPPPELPAKSG